MRKMNKIYADEVDNCSTAIICPAQLIPLVFNFILICVNPVHLRLNLF